MTTKVHCGSILFVLVLWLTCHATSWGVPVVQWNTVSCNYVGEYFYFYTEMASFGYVGAGIMGPATVDTGGGGITLAAENGTVGVSHSWFPVLYGSLVDDAAWRNAPDYLANIYESYELGSIHLNEGESIYLGIQLGSMEFFPNQVEYGWVELLYDGAAISLVSSATERTGLGIYAGTGTAVPEPTTGGFMLVGALGLIWRRHVRKAGGGQANQA